MLLKLLAYFIGSRLATQNPFFSYHLLFRLPFGYFLAPASSAVPNLFGLKSQDKWKSDAEMMMKKTLKKHQSKRKLSKYPTIRHFLIMFKIWFIYLAAWWSDSAIGNNHDKRKVKKNRIGLVIVKKPSSLNISNHIMVIQSKVSCRVFPISVHHWAMFPLVEIFPKVTRLSVMVLPFSNIRIEFLFETASSNVSLLTVMKKYCCKFFNIPATNKFYLSMSLALTWWK